MRVSVLGAGSFGTTIASLVSGHNETLLWARRSEVADEVNQAHKNTRYFGDTRLTSRLRATADLEEAVSRADVLVMGVPSHAFRSTLVDARPFLPPWVPVVSLVKGLEQDTMLRMTQIVEQELPGHPPAALAGPNIAREIIGGMAAASVLATEDVSVGTELQRILRRGMFRVYYNHDLVGCELGGALKNVIAIACGIAEGIGTGDNTRATMMTRGLAELTRLGVAMGGEPASFAGLTGLGDLIVTCMSPHSRNRHVGEQLGLGRPLDEVISSMHMVAEGVKTAPTVIALAERHGVAMPICQEVERVVRGEITGGEAYRGLYPPAGHEAEPG
jgi:glycerol-3-phosphate dehydrogenase (NAD(P)+)